MGAGDPTEGQHFVLALTACRGKQSFSECFHESRHHLSRGGGTAAGVGEGFSREEIEAEVNRIIAAWAELGYCRPEEVLILYPRTDLRKNLLGDCRELAGLPLVEYGVPLESGVKAIRHLSINRAKGLDALAVIVVGVAPFASLTRGDDQYTYFMGASRAKQLLAVVEG